MDMILLTLILTMVLAGVNGGNDVSKGVATLAGAGVTRYRPAILWGVVTTLAGSLLSLSFAARMTRLFSDGIVAAPPAPAFAVAVLVGAIAWVGLATLTRRPVSTTHAIVGALVGAGIQLAPGAIRWDVLVPVVAVPLVASVIISYLLSASASILLRDVPECACADVTVPQRISGGPVATLAASGMLLPIIAVTTGTAAAGRVRDGDARRLRISFTGAHWLTSGITGFARGLNDTPKIVAIGAFGGQAVGLDPRVVLAAVAASMAIGGFVGGMRVTRVLAEKVVRMGHGEGFTANLIAATLVGIGAHLGLPMSTTHVATGAIAGTAGIQIRRLNRPLLQDFLLAWTITPVVAGVVAGSAFALIR